VCEALQLRRRTKGLIVMVKEREQEKGSLRICKSSLVISWLGMGVARVLRMNAYEPMVGWKGEHPYSIGQ
jgi:hypothetical protein